MTSSQSEKVFRSAVDALGRGDTQALRNLWHRDGEFALVGGGDQPELVYRREAALRIVAGAPPPGRPPLPIRTTAMTRVGGWLVAETTVDLGELGQISQAWLCAIDNGRIVTLSWFPTLEAAAEAARRRPRPDIARLFEHVRDPVLLLDDDARVVDLNAAASALFGLDPDELRGRSFTAFIAEKDTPPWHHGWAVLRARGQLDAAAVIHDAAGTQHPVRIHAQPSLTPNRNLVVVRADAAQPATEPVDSGFRLTPRERDVFRLLALGNNAPEIAVLLSLSVSTVRTHVSNGIERMGARTRVQATTLALLRGEIAV